ncbi:MAG: S-layer homology domain-containing protein, partial [Eubacteriales bacterium]
MKKLVALSLILSLSMANFVYAYGKSSSGFIDVGSTHWAYKTINGLTGKGIIKGYSDNTFKPSGNITTAEFLKIVASLDGKEIEKTGNHWASGYIDYAKKEGYFPDGMFQEESYDIPITREKMAVVMAIVADKKDSEAENAKITQENREKLETAVKDWSSICNDCKSNVSKAMLKGIIGGYPDSSFKPLNTATRAEASTMIVRLMNPSERIKKEYEPLNEKAEKINKNERFYFYYNQLTADEKAIYSLIDKNIRDFKSNIPFGKSIGKESLSKIVQAYERDNPEIYWIYDFEYYQTDDGKGITEIMLKVPSDAKSVLARISNEADYILEKKPKNSDFYDTVKYIYEAVINRVEYVSDAPNNQDIRSAILQKQAVCTGYAKMFEYLCIKAGIPAT